MKTRTVVILTSHLAAGVFWQGISIAWAQGGDSDRDGIADWADRCPGQLETMNGHADTDGCPDSFNSLMQLATADIDSFWQRTMPRLGNDVYRPPQRIVPYTSENQTPCGPTLEGNAFYCSGDHSIYYDYNWMSGMLSTDYAPVTILAHEWGHLIQGLQGFRGMRYDIEAELQADCLAGVYTKDAEERGLLEANDLNEGMTSAFESGDYEGSWNDENEHGKPEDRIGAFFIGYRYSLNDCGNLSTGTGSPKLASLITGGVGIPAREEETTGSLSDNVPQRVGNFQLKNVQTMPELISKGATQALIAQYQSSNGATALYQLTAFRSGTESNDLLEEMLSFLAQNGYTQADEMAVEDSGSRLGRAVLLIGQNEILLWTNRELFQAVSINVRGQAVEFANNLMR